MWRTEKHLLMVAFPDSKSRRFSENYWSANRIMLSREITVGLIQEWWSGNELSDPLSSLSSFLVFWGTFLNRGRQWGTGKDIWERAEGWTSKGICVIEFIWSLTMGYCKVFCALLEVGPHCLMDFPHPWLCLSTRPPTIVVVRHPRLVATCMGCPLTSFPTTLPLLVSLAPSLGQVHSQQTVQGYVSIPSASFFYLLSHLLCNLLRLDLYHF